MKKDFTSTNCESSDCFADAEPSVARRLYRHVLRTTSHKQGPFGDCRLNTVVVGPQFVAGADSADALTIFKAVRIPSLQSHVYLGSSHPWF